MTPCISILDIEGTPHAACGKKICFQLVNQTNLLLFRKVRLVSAQFNNTFNREFQLVTRNPIYACLLSLQMGSIN